jgi:hypothetical protein
VEFLNPLGARLSTPIVSLSYVSTMSRDLMSSELCDGISPPLSLPWLEKRMNLNLIRKPGWQREYFALQDQVLKSEILAGGLRGDF